MQNFSIKRYLNNLNPLPNKEDLPIEDIAKYICKRLYYLRRIALPILRDKPLNIEEYPSEKIKEIILNEQRNGIRMRRGVLARNAYARFFKPEILKTLQWAGDSLSFTIISHDDFIPSQVFTAKELSSILLKSNSLGISFLNVDWSSDEIECEKLIRIPYKLLGKSIFKSEKKNPVRKHSKKIYDRLPFADPVWKIEVLENLDV